MCVCEYWHRYNQVISLNVNIKDKSLYFTEYYVIRISLIHTPTHLNAYPALRTSSKQRTLGYCFVINYGHISPWTSFGLSLGPCECLNLNTHTCTRKDTNSRTLRNANKTKSSHEKQGSHTFAPPQLATFTVSTNMRDPVLLFNWVSVTQGVSFITRIFLKRLEKPNKSNDNMWQQRNQQTLLTIRK